MVHPLIGLAIAIVLFKVIGFNMGLLGFLIKNTPTPLQSIWGHGPKCVVISFWMFIACTLASSFVKYIFYHIVGKVFGLIPTTALDDFWLYDYPINPINVPAVLIFNKPKEKTPEQMMDFIISKTSGS